MKKPWMGFALVLLALGGCRAAAPAPPGEAAPDHPPRLGAVRTYATLDALGFEWRFPGDTAEEARCGLRYREVGSRAWQEAWPPYRIRYTPPRPVAGRSEPFNGCAGSVFFLKPGRAYELWLTVRGGGLDDAGVVTVRTQSEPGVPAGAPTFHVVPGSGGGAGTAADPYRGLGEAQRHARPGDVFLLHAGTYAGGAGGEIAFNVAGAEGRWVVWKAAEAGVVFAAPVRIAADHVWLEGVHLRGDPDDPADWGLRTYGAPRRVVIRRNTFTDYFYSIALNHGGEAWLIEDNVIVGDRYLYTCWDRAAGAEIDDGAPGGCPEESWRGEGIELNHTSGHTVRYNRISRVADGISYPLENVDVYGNEIFDVTDDGIEADYGYANVRVWQNRISNARHNGLSFQPMNGGPWYFVRNQVAAPLESTLKLRRLARVLLAHNLLIGWDDAVAATYDTEGLRRLDSFNNLYVSASGRYVWEQADDGPLQARLDHDGFDWGGAAYAFKWGGERYPGLAEFQAATGLEPHGLVIDRAACWEDFGAQVTRPPDPAPSPAALPLKAGCPAVDAGLPLPNVGGPYRGAAPDLGPYELGLAAPRYGPR